MSTEVNHPAVAFMLANEGVEQVELTDPWKAVEDSGRRAVLIAPEVGKVQAFHHLEQGDAFEATVATGDARAEDYVALVLPGGVANPDQLRMDEPAMALIRSFVEAGKPVAAICHGPWTLIESGVASGRLLTSWPSLQTDLRNAGATWTDEEVVVCTSGPNTIITSRNPDDIPAFNRELLVALG